MNKELEQAAERIATSLYSKPEDDSDWIDDRIEELKQLILTDPFILELVKDRERLCGLRALMGYVECGEGVTVKLFQDDATKTYFIYSGEKYWFADSFNQAIDSAIEQGKKEKV